MHIEIPLGGDAGSLEWVRDLLSRHPGESPVYLLYRERPDVAPTRIRARRLLVRPSEELLQELRERLGPGAVRLGNGQTEAVPF